MSSIAIITASGTGVGIGHLRRSQRLQEELGGMVGVGDVAVNLVTCAAADFAASSLDGIADDVVVIDLPPRLRDDTLVAALERLRAAGTRVVGIDGPSEGIDLLIVPSFHVTADDLDRARRNGAEVRWGWDRLIIDPRDGVAPRGPNGPVLVLTGGSDAAGLGQHLPSLLDEQLPSGTRVDWVVGPLAGAPMIPSDPQLRWTEHHGLTDLRPLMQQAGYALAVYGVSVLELLHHGVPTAVLSPYGTRDLEHLDILEHEGLAVTATDPAGAVGLLCGLLDDENRAGQIARRATLRIPSSGTRRVAEEILELLP